MAENTKIEWANDSVSFWWGCEKIDPGCKFCYAKTIADRFGDYWGGTKPRLFIESAESTLWRLNRKAEREGKPRLVFINSMSDFFEDFEGPLVDRNGAPALLNLAEVRAGAFRIFDECQWLRFLLLTKRPENIRRMWPARCQRCYGDGIFQPTGQEEIYRCPSCGGSPNFRANCWLGTSAGTQATADRAIPELLKCRDLAPVLFVSAEPLLEEVCFDRLDWVIVGGESGPGARPMHPDWARSIRDQCQSAGVPFFFKQWGEWGPIRIDNDRVEIPPGQTKVVAVEHNGNRRLMRRFGKKAAERLLDGKEWNEMPQVGAAVLRGGGQK